jgi:hypothetical protein
MSMYGVIYRLPPGKGVQYQSAHGTTVVFEPVMRVPGRLDVMVRTQSTDATGKHDETSHAYKGIDRVWCERQDEALRGLGIDPNVYTII